MHFATKRRQTQILVWLIWAVACLVFWAWPEQATVGDWSVPDLPALPAVVTHDPGNGPLFPWHPRHRWRKWAWRRYCALRRAHRRAVWTARLARLALTGALTLAQVVDLLVRSQIRKHLGALPVLYALLETLQVRDIINRHCPTRAQVKHGSVALVLILNRLTMPLPLYQIADWLGRTALVYVLGIPAVKFNDDRLARTLDAIQPHCREIWQDVVQRALVQAEVDLNLIFYDLTAYILHGEYRDSQYAEFGFAHNTPMDKRKFPGQSGQDRQEWPERCGGWQHPNGVCTPVRQNRRLGHRRGEHGTAMPLPGSSWLAHKRGDGRRRPGQPERRAGSGVR